MRELEQRACSYLGRDPILHMDMLEALRRGDGSVAAVREDGALVYVAKSGAYLLAAEDVQAGEALCGGIVRPLQAAVHHEATARLVMDMLGFSGMMQCWAGAWLNPQPPEAEGAFTLLDPSQGPVIQQAVPQAFEEGELEERLRAGALQGLWEGQRLLGLAGLYPEGGLGYLTVLPELAGQGLEQRLAAWATAWCLQRCFAPFVHIPVDDPESLAMYQALGYSFSERPVCWLS